MAMLSMGIGRHHQSALMYLQCVRARTVCMFVYSGGRDHWAHDRRANRLSANGQQFVNIHALFFV
ncbi:hypothetical protein NL64_23995 [Pseudomonas fluorescens]|jgi:hypothetical protein|nr:hypothetical protein NL64_23995 [Pseudomonas fluorescens]